MKRKIHDPMDLRKLEALMSLSGCEFDTWHDVQKAVLEGDLTLAQFYRIRGIGAAFIKTFVSVFPETLEVLKAQEKNLPCYKWVLNERPERKIFTSISFVIENCAKAVFVFEGKFSQEEAQNKVLQNLSPIVKNQNKIRFENINLISE